MECELCHRMVKELRDGLCASCKTYHVPTFLRIQSNLYKKANRPLLELIKGGKDK
jgi:hypothetical protein